jgi:hypothetical protein
MTSITPSALDPALERSAARYRRLLRLYPRSFRDDYGDDLVQAYRDLLLFSTDRRGLWWRTARDLLSSSARQRMDSLRTGDRPPVATVIAALAALVVLFVIGAPFLLEPAIVLVGLPVFALTRFARATTVRRATGGSITRPVLEGTAALVPAGVAVAMLGEDAGWLVFMAAAGALIATAAVGLVWAISALLRQAGESRRSWRRPVLVLVPSIAVLAFIIGASYNSYRNSLGPPGDHSVENASVDTRALWQAAHDGDLAAVETLTTDTCADPWVKFPVDGGRHNAKGMAETQGLHGLSGPFGEISDHLGDYMDDWYDRCGQG